MYMSTFGVIAPIPMAMAANPDAVQVSPLNCDALSGDTRVCVVNQTHSTITEISCDGSLWGQRGIPLPRGRIPVGGIAIVNFAGGSCHSTIYVRTSDGHQHIITGQDVRSLTILPIAPMDNDNW